MRRLLLAVLIILASISVSGCNSDKDVESTQTPPPTEAPTAAATPTTSSESDSVGFGLGLYVIDESGEGEPLRTVDFPTKLPRWAPTGDRLYFMGDTRGGTGQDAPEVYTSSATGEGLTKLLEARGLHQTFSPDLSKVAYQVIKQGGGPWGTWEVHIADLADPTSDRKVADGILGEWSPDSAFLSYYSPACESSSLFVTTPAGEQTLVVPYAEGSYIEDVWIPNSSNLAYRRGGKTESGSVPDKWTVVDVRTMETTEVAELAGVGNESRFSPDGSKTAVVKDDKITVSNVADGTSHVIDLNLGRPPQYAGFWAVWVSWSPDGKKLAVAIGAANPRGFCD